MGRAGVKALSHGMIFEKEFHVVDLIFLTRGGDT